MIEDIVALEGDEQDGAPLLAKVMSAGKRLAPKPTLGEIRARAGSELQRLPDSLRRLQSATRYPVTIAPSLQKLADETDRRLAGVLKAAP
jgi:hypothetical protein